MALEAQPILYLDWEGTCLIPLRELPEFYDTIEQHDKRTAFIVALLKQHPHEVAFLLEPPHTFGNFRTDALRFIQELWQVYPQQKYTLYRNLTWLVDHPERKEQRKFQHWVLAALIPHYHQPDPETRDFFYQLLGKTEDQNEREIIRYALF